MKRKNRLSRLILFIFLLALPALACSSITGEGDDPTPVADTDVSDQTAETAPDQSSASADSDGNDETVSAGDEQSAGDTADTDSISESGEDPEKSGDPRESIISALRSGLEVDAMRLHIVTEDETTGLTTDVILAFVRPDRYQMKSDDIEFIVVEDTTYLKGPDGNWTTLPGTEMTNTVEATLDAFAGAAVIDSRQDSLSQRDVNFEGKETINGVETLVYSFDEGVPGVEFTGQIKMWIGEDDGLLYRQAVSTWIGDQESRILMDFEYGSDVTIEAPE